MARARKRITRKDLRQPDQFVTLTGRLIDLFEENRRIVLLVVSALIVLSLMLWGWNLYKDRQNRLAAEEFSRALSLYQAGKFTEALAQFQNVEGYGRSIYYELAILYQANAYVASSDWEKASQAGRRLLDNINQNPFLQQMALSTIGYAEERSARCKEAIEHYSGAEKLPGAFKEQALLGRARCSAQIGHWQGALGAYRQYIKEYPSSAIASDISLRIQRLEGSVGNP
jgi:tetratricopeptide (TPR) repeat protein